MLNKYFIYSAILISLFVGTSLSLIGFYYSIPFHNIVQYIMLSILFISIILYLLQKVLYKDINKLLKNIENNSFSNNFNTTEFKNINNDFKKLSNNLKNSNKRKEILISRLKVINESKDEIISSISHEFKNPISIISGYIQTILENDLNRDMEKKFLKKIDKNALNLSSLIDRLYLVTKLENNKIKMRKKENDIYELSKNVIEKLDNKRIILKGNSKIVNCDSDLIEIVLSNLLTNSLKYTKDEITLTISDKILIKDRGQGINEEELNHIKEKFYRIRKNDWDNSLGLGLAIVEKILKLHNSKLDIKSEIGKGSEFSFSI